MSETYSWLFEGFGTAALRDALPRRLEFGRGDVPVWPEVKLDVRRLPTASARATIHMKYLSDYLPCPCQVDNRGDNVSYLTIFHSRRYVDRGGKRIVGELRHVDLIVRVDWRITPERRAGELATAVGNHLIHVHVELRAAAGHPDMQRKHVLMLAGEDLVARWAGAGTIRLSVSGTPSGEQRVASQFLT